MEEIKLHFQEIYTDVTVNLSRLIIFELKYAALRWIFLFRLFIGCFTGDTRDALCLFGFGRSYVICRIMRDLVRALK